MSKVTTLEEARQLARDVAVAGAAFAGAIRSARSGGLVVDIDTVATTKMGDAWPQREVVVKMAVEL
jgi:hypothetical protein